LESLRTAAELGVASDLVTLRHAAFKKETVRFIRECASKGAGLDTVVGRAMSIARRQSDPRYENKSDVALAILLTILSDRNLEIGQLVAGIVANVPRLWWAERVAVEILNGRRSAASDSFTQVSVLADSGNVESSNPSGATDQMIFLSVQAASDVLFGNFDRSTGSGSSFVSLNQVVTAWSITDTTRNGATDTQYALAA
jgi:hypothetical protein